MRAKRAPAGRETRDTAREAKEPGVCSTRRRRERSGWTQAGMRGDLGVEIEREKVVEGVMIGFVEEMGSALVGKDGRGGAEVIAAGDMLVLSWLSWLNEVSLGERIVWCFVLECGKAGVVARCYTCVGRFTKNR